MSCQKRISPLSDAKVVGTRGRTVVGRKCYTSVKAVAVVDLTTSYVRLGNCIDVLKHPCFTGGRVSLFLRQNRVESTGRHRLEPRRDSLRNGIEDGTIRKACQGARAYRIAASARTGGML